MTPLDQSVVGLGFVSPVATTAREHVFLVRAEAAMHAGRPFVDGTGEPLEVLHCPLVDPTLPLAERLTALGTLALDDALGPLATWSRRTQVAAHLCAPAPEEPLTSELLAACERRWAQAHQLRFGRRFAGAASCYEALPLATEALASGASAVVLLAIDTAAHPAILAQRLHPVPKWVPVPPRLSEAAAVVVVTTPALAAELAVTFGRITYAGVMQGTGTDRDDDPVDGRAMTQLIRHAASQSALPWGNAFGPFTVDNLRRASWQAGMLRNRHAFALDGDQQCVEHHIGNVGAASGLAQLVYALGRQHHELLNHSGTTVAWTVSHEGARGLGVIAR